MESRVEQTLCRHAKGYNCAQAVACTYCDLEGVDENTMFKMLEGFGLGMGGMQGTCGAVSGAEAIVGLKNSSGCQNPTSKAATYKVARAVFDEFVKKNGSAVCRELKGVETGAPLRSCDGCIQDAAAIVEKLLTEK